MEVHKALGVFKDPRKPLTVSFLWNLTRINYGLYSEECGAGESKHRTPIIDNQGLERVIPCQPFQFAGSPCADRPRFRSWSISETVPARVRDRLTRNDSLSNLRNGQLCTTVCPSKKRVLFVAIVPQGYCFGILFFSECIAIDSCSIYFYDRAMIQTTFD